MARVERVVGWFKGQWGSSRIWEGGGCCAVLCWRFAADWCWWLLRPPASAAAVPQVVSQQPPDVAAQRQEAYWQLTASELLEDANGYQRALGLLVTLLARDKDLVSPTHACCWGACSIAV